MSTATTPALKTEKQPDRNWVSLNADSIVLYAGTPDAEHYANDEVKLSELDYVPSKPKAWETALKVSERLNTHLTSLRVAQCKENALDVNNRSFSCSFDGEWGVTGDEGEQIWTVKGASSHIRVTGVAHSLGKRADLVVGLWSDQSTRTSHNLDFRGLRHVTGRPLTVILCRVNNPWFAWIGRAPADIQLPANARVLKLKSLGAQVHWWAKLAAVKLGLFTLLNRFRS